jgi:hypothetical protein
MENNKGKSTILIVDDEKHQQSPDKLGTKLQ